jgi:hypothetical protein
LEQASVLNSADPGCGDFDPAGFPSANPTPTFRVHGNSSERVTSLFAT